MHRNDKNKIKVFLIKKEKTRFSRRLSVLNQAKLDFHKLLRKVSNTNQQIFKIYFRSVEELENLQYKQYNLLSTRYFNKSNQNNSTKSGANPQTISFFLNE